MHITENEAKIAMRNTFVRLMQAESCDGVRWLGSVNDLVELVHIMWYDGWTIGRSGEMLNFSTTVRRLCTLCRLKAPKHPSVVYNNIVNRKNTERRLLARCCKLMEQGEEPLQRFIEWKEGIKH